jgi:hypothetical protein
MLNTITSNQTILKKRYISLPLDIFVAGFLFGSSSRLIRLSPSFISSHLSTGNLEKFNLIEK